MATDRYPTGGLGIHAISIDQLVALNDEIAALVRAGIPLDQGLVEFGTEMPGRVGEIALRLGQRIQAGEGLEQALLSDDSSFSPIWRAVVAAGLRSGNLAAALEGLASTGRRLSELRQAWWTALVYPIVVVSLAFVVFMFTVTQLAPAMAGAYLSLTMTTEPFVTSLARLGQSARWWGVAVPVVAAVALVGWIIRSRKLTWRSDAPLRRRQMDWLPRVGQVLRDCQSAAFAELMALLIRHRVPLDESLELAGAASGNGELKQTAKALAERLRRGESVTAQDARQMRIPPLLGWLISAGWRDNRLAEQLSTTAERYRQRAARAIHRARVGIPLLATVVIGGLVTLLHGLVVFVPISRLLELLARPG